ncbi:MAG: PIG-L family deacetylase [Candidatus Tectimicrobiota bacterium]
MNHCVCRVLIYCLVWTACAFPMAQAQVQEPAENLGAAAAYRALLCLRSTATVLHTTAHPDDEDGALLTWLARRQGVRTGLLTLNRGEGGANLIGSELNDALGILRTEELLAAGRYYGVDQMFTRAVDVGFSKRLDETLAHWDRDVILGDIVHAIRMYRPDVLVSRFHGTPRDGHGHHQAAGLLSLEAFKAAADPQRFPEHLQEGLRPWQVKKFYLSVRESEAPVTMKIDVGAYDPLVGKSYREIARTGLSHQRSQGAGQVRAVPGASLTGVRLADSTLPPADQEQSLFDGIDTTLPGIASLVESSHILPALMEISRHVEAAINTFDALKPWGVASELAAGMRATRTLIEQVKTSAPAGASTDHVLFLLGNKEQEFNEAMHRALGLVLEVLVDPEPGSARPAASVVRRDTSPVVIPGQRFSLTMHVTNRSPVPLARGEARLAHPADWEVTAFIPADDLLGNNVTWRAPFEVQVPDNAAYTRPHWSRANAWRDAMYQIDTPQYLHYPFAPPELVGVFSYEVEGVRFALSRPVQTASLVRPWGEQRRLLTVAPALNVSMTPRLGIVPGTAAPATVSAVVTVANNVPGEATGQVTLRLPEGWTATPAEHHFTLTHAGEARDFPFHVSVPPGIGGAEYTVYAVAEYAGRAYQEGYQVIAHRDLEPRHLYRPATMVVRVMDVQVAPDLTVGYVMGVGDEVPQALTQLGVRVTMLAASDLANGQLEQFDAIIVGIRASAVRHELKTSRKRLLDYVERGGNLIYQYQTQEFDAVPYGPYPYKLTARAEEVSEEEAPVTILEPAHPVFHWPNTITEADFHGWVVERGSKWMTTWDKRYTPLLASHDHQQAPQQGGLLYAQYGRGTFIYAAYAFYRQLPAGVPGGYRLFANLISVKKRP